MTASVSFSIVIGGTAVSPDGTTIVAPTSDTVVNSDGTWGFGGSARVTNGTTGYSVLFNGTAHGAIGCKLATAHGNLYLFDDFGSWYLHQLGSSDPNAWTGTTAPPTLSLSWNPAMPGGATIDASTPLGTVVAKVQGVWSDGSAFADSYRFSAPAYDGSNAIPSGVSAVNGSANYALGDVVPASDTNAITSTGIYALVVCPDHSGALILNPHGPGISGASGTTEDVDVEPF